MQAYPTPIIKDLVLIGGGHAHVSVLKSFAMRPMPGVRMTLVSRETHAPYSGMLPGLIAGHYDFDQAHIDVRRLARFAGADYIHDQATSIDPDARQVLFAQRAPLAFDVASINSGATPNTRTVPGAAEHAIPVKPIDGFLEKWHAARAAIAARSGPLSIGVVGGGAGGVELLLALHHALKAGPAAGYDAKRPLQFHLITDSDRLLPSYIQAVQRRFAGLLETRQISLHTGCRVIRVEADGVICAPDRRIALDQIFWVTAAGAPTWLAGTGLALDRQGFLAVDASLQSTSHAGIFAAGDVAGVVEHPRPKAGVFAVRQGPPLAENLRRLLQGKAVRPFRPQQRFLTIISTGDRNAVAAWGPLSVSGGWVWRWKDWIDRRFMDRFNDLPEMEGERRPAIAAGLADAEALEAISAAAMRCGGCGAKVGAELLDRVLERMAPQASALAAGARDDAALIELPPGKTLVQTVDAFRAFIDDAYLFGRIAANHALGDIYAMGASPHSALAVATLPYGLEEKVEAQLGQLMAGALCTLNEAETALVGGHTSEGAELALGFAVNGLADRKAVLRKSGMRPGQALVLTKPLGTGTLFAADMRLKAKGRWIDKALEVMLQSNAAAAGILRKHGATACTDVTGFGLLGHLVEMTRASGTGAIIDLDALPALEGAAELLGHGITSSLHPQNVRLRRAIEDTETAAGHPLYGLLFDPQTAGGLLASLPKSRAGACLEALKTAGYGRAALIGEVRRKTGTGQIRLTTQDA